MKARFIHENCGGIMGLKFGMNIICCSECDFEHKLKVSERVIFRPLKKKNKEAENAHR